MHCCRYLTEVYHHDGSSLESADVQARLLQLVGRQRDLLEACGTCFRLVQAECRM
jgi:hypothetical protein